MLVVWSRKPCIGLAEIACFLGMERFFLDLPRAVKNRECALEVGCGVCGICNYRLIKDEML